MHYNFVCVLKYNPQFIFNFFLIIQPTEAIEIYSNMK